jgi:peptide deformylase
MKIISVPHTTLRQIAQPITTYDKKTEELIQQLEVTLKNTQNPKGVGLAAPQINISKRAFATHLPKANDDQDDEEEVELELRVYLNPEIVDHSQELTLGPDPKNPILEGCLSIPKLYGPVPRWAEVTLQYQVVEDNELVTYEEVFYDYAARVVQHELDHLNGILFTDYSLKYDLPVYQTKSDSDKMVEIDKDLLQAF